MVKDDLKLKQNQLQEVNETNGLVLEELSKLREGRTMNIDRSNKNRYGIVFCENDLSKTAYYCSTPIYNVNSNKLIDMMFKENENDICAVGSNTKIIVSQKIRLENSDGYCAIELGGKAEYISSKKIQCGNSTVHLTTNGIAVICYISDSEKKSFFFERHHR